MANKDNDYLYKNVAHVNNNGVKISKSYRFKKFLKMLLELLLFVALLVGFYFAQDILLKDEANLPTGEVVSYSDNMKTSKVGDSIIVKADDYNIINKKGNEFKISVLPGGVVSIDGELTNLEKDEYMVVGDKGEMMVLEKDILGIKK